MCRQYRILEPTTRDTPAFLSLCATCPSSFAQYTRQQCGIGGKESDQQPEPYLTTYSSSIVICQGKQRCMSRKAETRLHAPVNPLPDSSSSNTLPKEFTLTPCQFLMSVSVPQPLFFFHLGPFVASKKANSTARSDLDDSFCGEWWNRDIVVKAFLSDEHGNNRLVPLRTSSLSGKVRYSVGGPRVLPGVRQAGRFDFLNRTTLVGPNSGNTTTIRETVD